MELGVFRSRKGFFFVSGDGEEAHGNVGGGKKQRLVQQILSAHLSFSSRRREGREKTLKNEILSRISAKEKHDPRSPSFVIQNHPSSTFSDIRFPNCSEPMSTPSPPPPTLF